MAADLSNDLDSDYATSLHNLTGGNYIGTDDHAGTSFPYNPKNEVAIVKNNVLLLLPNLAGGSSVSSCLTFIRYIPTSEEDSLTLYGGPATDDPTSPGFGLPSISINGNTNTVVTEPVTWAYHPESQDIGKLKFFVLSAFGAAYLIRQIFDNDVNVTINGEVISFQPINIKNDRFFSTSDTHDKAPYPGYGPYSTLIRYPNVDYGVPSPITPGGNPSPNTIRSRMYITDNNAPPSWRVDSDGYVQAASEDDTTNNTKPMSWNPIQYCIPQPDNERLFIPGTVNPYGMKPLGYPRKIADVDNDTVNPSLYYVYFALNDGVVQPELTKHAVNVHYELNCHWPGTSYVAESADSLKKKTATPQPYGTGTPFSLQLISALYTAGDKINHDGIDMIPVTLDTASLRYEINETIIISPSGQVDEDPIGGGIVRNLAPNDPTKNNYQNVEYFNYVVPPSNQIMDFAVDRVYWWNLGTRTEGLNHVPNISNYYGFISGSYYPNFTKQVDKKFPYGVHRNTFRASFTAIV